MNIPKPKDEWTTRDGINNKEDPEVIYAVSWIEVEFGQRDEGHKLYVDLETCIKDTKEGSKNGPYKSCPGYLGPVRPLYYTTIPFDFLEDEYKEKLRDKGTAWTKNYWQPRFKGKTVYIND
jgi:hypothetical protein